MKCIFGGCIVIPTGKPRHNQRFTIPFLRKNKTSFEVVFLLAWPCLYIRQTNLCSVLHKCSPIQENFGFPPNCLPYCLRTWSYKQKACNKNVYVKFSTMIKRYEHWTQRWKCGMEKKAIACIQQIDYVCEE